MHKLNPTQKQIRAAARLVACALLLAAFITSGRAEPLIIDLWPNDAPGSEGHHGEEIWTERGKGFVDRSVANVHQPTITAYLPVAEIATGTGIIVAPGGGYRHLAIDKEGHDIAKYLNSKGIAAFVLKYRLPRTEGFNYTVDTAMMDAQRAIRIVRSRASEWKLDSKRIGVMGFSAGGNLASLMGMKHDKGKPEASDAIERQSSRPDFLVLGYPSIPQELTVTADTPPTFLVHADDDQLSAENSVRFYLALKKVGVSAEMHIYSKGGHGFGILNRDIPASAWPLRLEAWMKEMKFTK